jgi:predicted Zn finger-like uncharacterized protein
MLTTCTACGTQFRVNTTQLRAVHGLVRCSRCHSVFDAFETLREEFEAVSAARQAPAEDADVATGAAPVEQLQEAPLIAAIDSSTDAVDPGDPEIQLRASKPPAPVDDLFADLWGESPAPADSTSEQPHKSSPTLIEDQIPRPPALMRDKALYKHAELPPRERQVSKAPRQPRTLNLWAVGIALLTMLLGIQLVSAYRLPLSRSPLIGKPLSSLYSALGHPLTATPVPGSWLVSNINVTSNPETPGTLSITGTLANGANFPQPWPVLRVELTDRYGDALRARDFTTQNYLPSGQSADLLNPGGAARFRIDVVDPGPEAVGFQVQPCLDLDGSRECSNMPGA